MKHGSIVAVALGVLTMVGFALGAEVVPPEIMQPGTQPGEAGNLESPNKCDNCHGGYDEARAYSNEPAFGWRGSAMGNAGRDPIFWATMAIAEQDFDGAGDLCIRCHSTAGWYGGRSTPTDGSGLQASDDDGVDCDTCHTATNPDDSEHAGIMTPPFVANDGSEGYYGSGMLSLWGSSDKLGPYGDAEARHQWMQSGFHRGDGEGDNLCGSCHDVSNPVVGDLAPNHGIQPTADSPVSSYDFPPLGEPNLGSTVLEEKAAFNNPPYAYGIVERTFSEWKSGALDTLDVREYLDLPDDLQVESGALNMAYQSALLAGGTYEDGSIRTFSCMSCHMRPDIGEGCNKAGAPTRSDLPKHDMSGGNYWMWPLIQYQDQQGDLRLGGGLTSLQIAAMDAGRTRAEDQLRMAASLTVAGNKVRITNLTGHKLITGYPEGRRMWLNIKWYRYDSNGQRIDVDEAGAYGPLPGASFTFDGTTYVPESIIDLNDPRTKIYEAHPAITQEWAQTLRTLDPNHYNPIVLGYNRYTGNPEGTIGELANGELGPYVKTFHFVLNNHVAEDNRIPPYGMDYETARIRNALPVPATQYGGGTASYGDMTGVYEYWDEIDITPPEPATHADITLYYQGTSWEYVQFLWKANNGTDPGQGGNAFLGEEGEHMLEAWLHADPAAPMVPPFVMATATWPSCVAVQEVCSDAVDNDCDGLVDCDDAADCGTDLICCDASEICNDGVDNDCDSWVDCNDADCDEDAQCQVDCTAHTSKGSCNDDPDCEWVGSPKNGSCQPAAGCTLTGPEAGQCGDGVDNDCDGLTDCADNDDCGNDPICQVTCSVYTTRNLCNAQAACRWDNKNKICSAR